MTGSIRLVSVACIMALAGLMPRVGVAAPLNPLFFSTLGDFPSLSGNYTVNTSASANPTIVEPNGTVIQGVYYVDSPGHTVAVFTFSSLNVASGETIVASGAVPLVLLSQGDATIGGTINGNASLVNFQAVGGPGGGSLTSPGTGRGTQFFGNGSGGGFGGAGGMGGIYTANNGQVTPGTTGGITYGNLLNSLQGGSAGGGTSAGGGAIEIGAIGAIHLQSTALIEADGLSATFTSFGSGGGSGGGLFFHANTITLDAGALISAKGGNGAPAVNVTGTGGGSGGGGGGGGGGEVQFESSTSPTFAIGQVTLAGGTGGSPGNGTTNGAFGSFGVLVVPAVPEPSSFVMLATAIVLGLGCRHGRHPRARAR